MEKLRFDTFPGNELLTACHRSNGAARKGAGRLSDATCAGEFKLSLGIQVLLQATPFSEVPVPVILLAGVAALA